MSSVKFDKKASMGFIVPTKTIIKSKGKIYYKEDDRAWSLLRFRKEIIDEFNQLREKYSQFSYDAIYYRTYEELEKALKDFKKVGQPLPILMWISKDMKELVSGS